jgi:uncharacterized tellurite resistance protein B-like protein
MLDKLDKAARLHLMRFVCSFAWADLEIQDKERAFVKKLVAKLGLDKEELAQVQAWLQVPPPAEQVDPTRIPREHRQIFIDMAKALVEADGQIDPEERESLALLEALTR